MRRRGCEAVPVMPRLSSPARWTEACVTAPADDHAHILTTAVRPLLDKMTAERVIRRWFLWLDRDDGGPCLRLRIELAKGAGESSARERLLDAIDELTVVLATDLFAEMAWGPRSCAVAEDLLCDLRPRLVTLLEEGERGSLDVALDIMTAHMAAVGSPAVAEAMRPVDAAPDGAFLGFMSYRSHADGFFVMCGDSASARQAMQDRYLRAAPVFERRVQAVLDQLGDGGHSVSRAAAWWHDEVRRHLPAAVESFGPRDRPAGLADELGYLGDANDLDGSAFHQVIQGAEGFQRFLRTDPTFQGVRLCTSVLYLCLHTLGLRLIDRYFLCHAISNACEALYGVDAVELVGRLADHHGAAPGSDHTSEVAPRGHVVAQPHRADRDADVEDSERPRFAVASSEKERS